MNRPDTFTLYLDARRHRTRLIGDLIARLMRGIARRVRNARAARVPPASVTVR